MAELFNSRLRAMRRDRAARTGPELFLFERAFDDCLDRILLIHRGFHRALLIGCPDPTWRKRLGRVAREVDVRDPGPLFAASAGGAQIVEDCWEPEQNDYDLVLAIGTLDTVNDLPIALRLIRHAMAGDGFFIGVVAGGDSLPALRAAMRAADAITGGASPHVHPRIEPSALSLLLAEAGFERPVVDVDRVEVSYPSLARLVHDLRAMGATNSLRLRPSGLSRAQREAAAESFAGLGPGERTTETFELIHFACWNAPNG